ncbi:MAG TPA: glutaredoxin 3 [Gammaproteobacteria bacterium]|nr:glutaredoxin 3 [Gammaproteobacteria bacterium]
MPAVVMYSTGFCPYCVRARMLLDRKSVIYTDIRVDLEPALRAEMIQRSGRTSVPQIFIDDFHVGGCDDMYALEQQGRLDPLLHESK